MMDPNNEQDRQEMARTHNPPPEVPRDRMWAKIDAARAGRRNVARPDFTPQRGPAFRIMRLAAAVAAVLVVGIFIGRLTRQPSSVPTTDPVPVAAIPEDTAPDPGLRRDVYAMAARDLFGRADFLLTDFKVRSCGRDDLSEVPDWAGGMLVQTRLLMDTPAADDLEMKNLLEELELVLAQIVGLSKDNCARDMAWIRRGLQERATIDRLRTVSAGSEI
ncbi:MAG: hypothetical protein ABFS42_02535 [Candidatus Krumholzibacteriota bacterium]